MKKLCDLTTRQTEMKDRMDHGYRKKWQRKAKAPKTPAEWQDAVDAAEFYLALDSAQKYGLITGGPEVDVDRCDDILRAGRERGIVPHRDAIERGVGELMRPTGSPSSD